MTDDATLTASPPYRTVTIPGREEHDGYFSIDVTLRWVCPTCAMPRGEPYPTHSFDGSRRLSIHGWKNPCDHIDKYAACRHEAELTQLHS